MASKAGDSPHITALKEKLRAKRAKSDAKNAKIEKTHKEKMAAIDKEIAATKERTAQHAEKLAASQKAIANLKTERVALTDKLDHLEKKVAQVTAHGNKLAKSLKED